MRTIREWLQKQVDNSKEDMTVLEEHHFRRGAVAAWNERQKDVDALESKSAEVPILNNGQLVGMASQITNDAESVNQGGFSNTHDTP